MDEEKDASLKAAILYLHGYNFDEIVYMLKFNSAEEAYQETLKALRLEAHKLTQDHRSWESRRKSQKAIELHEAGLSYGKIAIELGYASNSGAYVAIHRTNPNYKRLGGYKEVNHGGN